MMISRIWDDMSKKGITKDGIICNKLIRINNKIKFTKPIFYSINP